MMRGATLAVIALLSVSLVANATEYFYDDFEDGDVTDWTVLTAPTHTATVAAWIGGAYGLEGSMYNDTGVKDAQMNQTGLSPTVGNVVWLSADFRHTGGYNGGGGASYKHAAVWFLTATGEGYGLQFSGARWDSDGPIDLLDVSLRWTDGTGNLDIGGDEDGAGIAGQWDQPGIMSTDNWGDHRLEACIDWDNYIATVYLDGAQIAQELTVIAPGEEWTKDFVEVRVCQRNVLNQWGFEPVIVDDIYAGDVQNPHTDPPIVGGDADSNLKVELVDLGVLATYYNTGGNPWTQADFNFDYTVDLVDLGILATNYGYDGTGAGVPEPATMALFGLAGLALLRKRS